MRSMHKSSCSISFGKSLFSDNTNGRLCTEPELFLRHFLFFAATDKKNSFLFHTILCKKRLLEPMRNTIPKQERGPMMSLNSAPGQLSSSKEDRGYSRRWWRPFAHIIQKRRGGKGGIETTALVTPSLTDKQQTKRNQQSDASARSCACASHPVSTSSYPIEVGLGP